MKKGILLVLALAFTVSACRMGNRPQTNNDSNAQPTAPASDNPTQPPPAPSEVGASALSFSPGRNDYSINVDNTPREFIVYVPSGYDPAKPTPLLLMYHGSNQSGNIMYENTDWVNKAEKETIIVIFPTAWKYPLRSEPGLHEKWNAYHFKDEAAEGAELKDDVKFTRVMVDLAKSTFNIDAKRIFASGFSNGGGFVVTRLTVEMNDVFAAYAISGTGIFGDGVGAGSLLTQTPAPQARVSLYAIVGTQDEKVSYSTGLERPFPIQPRDIFNSPPFQQMFVNTTTLLRLSMDYSVETNAPSTIFTFRNSLDGAGNEFIFRMVKGLFHEYPAGDNNAPGVNASDIFWEFFLAHTMP